MGYDLFSMTIWLTLSSLPHRHFVMYDRMRLAMFYLKSLKCFLMLMVFGRTREERVSVGDMDSRLRFFSFNLILTL